MSPADEPTRYQNSRMRKFNREFGYETRDQSFEESRKCNGLGRGDQVGSDISNADNFDKYRKKKESYNHLGRGDRQSAVRRKTDSRRSHRLPTDDTEVISASRPTKQRRQETVARRTTSWRPITRMNRPW